MAPCFHQGIVQSRPKRAGIIECAVPREADHLPGAATLARLTLLVLVEQIQMRMRIARSVVVDRADPGCLSMRHLLGIGAHEVFVLLVRRLDGKRDDEALNDAAVLSRKPFTACGKVSELAERMVLKARPLGDDTSAPAGISEARRGLAAAVRIRVRDHAVA